MTLLLANAASASIVMRLFIAPVIATMCALASLVSIGFLINGGFHYMTSSGNPERLDYAKKIIRGALLGLVLVLGAGVLTAILVHAYSSYNGAATNKVPSFTTVKQATPQNSLTGAVISIITSLLLNIAQTIAAPFMSALTFFTKATPLMADNSSVFNLWLAVVGITDSLFALVVGLLGFHVMSLATFGLEEIEFKHLIPRLGLVFLLINSSIFAIDATISLSNAMIRALQAGFPSGSVWSTLAAVTKATNGMGVATLLIMLVFLTVSVFLLVYYVGRIITLYLGAVLAPLVIMLWLLPPFKDFAETAAKLYLIIIFVLFVQVVILQLATSMFATLLVTSGNKTPDPIMALIVGLATVIALLKTQGVISEMSYVSTGPKAARQLGTMFVGGVSMLTKPARGHS